VWGVRGKLGGKNLPSALVIKDLFARLPSAKITEIGQFTPAAWTKALSTRLAQMA
jgi:hypothetical protein